MGLATSMENAKILTAFGKTRRKYNMESVNSRKNVVIFFTRRLYQVLLSPHIYRYYILFLISVYLISFSSKRENLYL